MFKQFQAELFTKISKHYDQFGPQVFSSFGKTLAEIAEIKEGFSVLDIGCGRGASLIPAAKLVGTSGKVVGIDIAEGMITELKKELEIMEIKNIELFADDAETFEFKEKFDVVLAGFSVSAFSNLRKIFKKFKELLKPKGRVAISNWDKFAHEGWEWMAKAIREHISIKTRTNAVTEEYQLDTALKMELFFKDMGLKNIKISTFEKLFYYKNELEWWESSFNSGMRGIFDKMDNKSLESLKKKLFKELSKIKTCDGIPYPAKAIFGTAQKPNA
ncbi:MAG: class I SAM-dependent methyltransferase [bacterium]